MFTDHKVYNSGMNVDIFHNVTCYLKRILYMKHQNNQTTHSQCEKTKHKTFKRNTTYANIQTSSQTFKYRAHLNSNFNTGSYWKEVSGNFSSEGLFIYVYGVLLTVKFKPLFILLVSFIVHSELHTPVWIASLVVTKMGQLNIPPDCIILSLSQLLQNCLIGPCNKLWSTEETIKIQRQCTHNRRFWLPMHCFICKVFCIMLWVEGDHIDHTVE